MKFSNLVSDLSKRHVFRVAGIYAVIAWLLLQLSAIVLPTFEAPDWVMKVITVLLVLGFPVALMLAWAFEGTRAGGTSSDAEEDTSSRSSKRVLATVGLAGTLCAVVAVGAWWWWWQPTATPERPVVAGNETAETLTLPAAAISVDPQSVAVLPFESLSANAKNAYFATGLQDLILTKLAHIEGLQVESRTATAKYGSDSAGVQAIARALGVASLLEGSVQRVGDQVLVNVQLIDAVTGNHMWAKSYQRKLDDIFGVEGEIAGKVADALKVHLSPEEVREVARKPTDDPEAYRLYLKAVYEATQFSTVDPSIQRLNQAVAYLQQAIARDPKFALAFAVLSNLQSTMLLSGVKSGEDVRRNALKNARMAIALQPDLAMAHIALGIVLFEDQPKQAFAELEKVAMLEPENPNAPLLSAQFHAAQGEWREAAEAAAKAFDLAPRNTKIFTWAVLTQVALHEYQDAERMLAQRLVLKPQAVPLRALLAKVKVLQGEPAAAAEQVARLPEGWPVKSVLETRLYWLRRDQEQALRTAESMPAMRRKGFAGFKEWLIARSARALGRAGQARAALEAARKKVQAALEAHSDSPLLYNTLALVEMSSGNRDAAIAAIDTALTLLSESGLYARSTPNYRLNKAKILAHFGEADAATAILRKLLTTPGGGLAISRAVLKLSPAWDPIRGTSAFLRLVEESVDPDPA